MATAGLTQYQQLVEAVGNYYGVGSDQWVEIARYGLNADNCAQILSQTPNVSTTISKSGKVLSYTVDDVVSTSAQGASAVINSNTQVATMASKATAKLPANMTVDGTGKVVAESGLKTVSSGSTVSATLGKVAVGVGAVAAGIQLGAAIDGALYNANPDFWDSNGMSAINPQTWDSVCSTQGGKDVFNMVFGIDKDTGETQAYMQQEALAQIAQYLAVMGAFSTSETVDGYEPINTGATLYYPNSYRYPTPLVNSPLAGETVGGESRIISITDGSNVKMTAVAQNDSTYILYALSSSPFNMHIEYPTGSPSDLQGIQATDDIYGAYYFRNYTLSYNTLANYNINTVGSPIVAQDLYRLLFHNSDISASGGISGITPQQGATTPSGITSEMTTAEVLARLQELYPDLFNRAITNEVVQPDGSTETFTYVPVGFPDEVTKPTPTSELQPTGGTGTSQASDTITENSPESLLQTFLDIFTTPDPYEPTDKPNPDDYPDTGAGVTPTPVIPTGSASALYSIYNPSQAELNSFGAWLWSNDFVDQLKKIFNDPMQAIIGLHKIFATPSTSGTGTIKVGYLDSEVSANLVSNQYTTIDCGTINLYEYFGNALDYTQTEVYIYLPFVGIVRLNTDDIMRGAINVVYKIDVLTGACLCTINVTRDLSGGQLYTYSGNCAVQYPLSSGSYMGIVSGLLGIAGSVVGTVATGGAMLPLALGVGASAIGGMKTRVEHSGSISGNAGAMGIKTPYLIIRRPQTAIADNFRIYDGASQNKYVSIGSLGGYVRAKYVNLENISEATGEELKAIEDELKNGILI
jgi:hypothetical protein